MLFRDRLAESARGHGPIILATDILNGTVQSVVRSVDNLQAHICAVKMNFHILLPLGIDEIREIIDAVHAWGLQCIADIKLNDINNTNLVTSNILYGAGFDAIIVNPIMGPDALSALVRAAHSTNNGIISLCHMSSAEGAVSYEMRAGHEPVYEKFLEWGLKARVDGIIVGATFPDIIHDCKRKVRDRLDILSPGVGAQGGSAKISFASGTDYIIVGRTLLNSENPSETAVSILS
ncbi:MAG: orotidine 5'-phosphate decarboxylase [Cenarchaeum sp. SB0665_bin_23]|nr:orotidine 5'-phosphate decarboxylase [Cenarchaeum sp. SB0665_bin_23]MYG33680.1 orotidine 5'-phosphate decarboxylase [Cenarchaeum sp. SB0677_bin_16]